MNHFVYSCSRNYSQSIREKRVCFSNISKALLRSVTGHSPSITSPNPPQCSKRWSYNMSRNIHRNVCCGQKQADYSVFNKSGTQSTNFKNAFSYHIHPYGTLTTLTDQGPSSEIHSDSHINSGRSISETKRIRGVAGK